MVLDFLQIQFIAPRYNVELKKTNAPQKPNSKASNSIIAFPKTELTISLDLVAKWQSNETDYCPGCVVQIYFGMTDKWSQGIVQYGVSNHNESATKNFEAPDAPGYNYF